MVAPGAVGVVACRVTAGGMESHGGGRMRRFVILGFLGLFVVLLAAPAQAAANRLGKIVVLNGRTTVAQGEVASVVVVFHGRTIIDGQVNGSVVVFDGQTRISGDVRDNVLVFRGRVDITEGAHIGGDLVTNETPEVTVGAFAIGRWIVKPPAGRMKAFLAGWGVLRVLALIPFFGGLVWTIVALFGLGATAVAVWRSRRAVREGTSPPPPPAPTRPTSPVPPPAPAGS